MSIILDRTKNTKGKSSGNRERFKRRSRKQIRDAVKKRVASGNISDIMDDGDKVINIPNKDLSEPSFHNGKGGKRDLVLPGNKNFNQGDLVERPPKGGGRGSGGSPDGEGNDDFEFILSHEEFMDVFFEDMELPDMIKESAKEVDDYIKQRAGFSSDGNPAQLNVERTMRHATTRRIAMECVLRDELEEFEKLLLEMEPETADYLSLVQKIKLLKDDIENVPFIDEMDIKYNRWERVPNPSTTATVFFVQDVSWSMGEWEKNIAKKFYVLMCMFLRREYDKVEIIYIRHHTVATECDEDEFFHSTVTGGTMVSSALKLVSKIIEERYNDGNTNLYITQLTDGDNWTADNADVRTELNNILPRVQYYAYGEVNQYGHVSDLWRMYEDISEEYRNFNMSKIENASDVYDSFRKLFEKNTNKEG